MKKNYNYAPLIAFFIVLSVILLLFVPSFKSTVFIYQEKIKLLLISHYLVNGWILLFLILFSVIGFCVVLYKIYYTEPRKSIYAHHVMQEIKGAVWKWHWSENKIEQLWCFCPHCNDELSYDNDHLLNTITFSCQQCKQQISKFDAQSVNGVLTFVKNEIRRILKRDKKLHK